METSSLAVAARATIDASIAAGLPPIVGLDEKLASLGVSETFSGELENGWNVGIRPAADENDGHVFVLMCDVDQRSPDIPAIVASLAHVCREMLARTTIHSAASMWVGGGAQCLPETPLTGMRGQLVVTTERAVEDAYDRPASFWSAWDRRTEYGDRVLLERATDARDSVDLLARLIGPQWELARAAKAGRTRHHNPRVQTEEKKIYLAGESPLEIVGYSEPEKLAEMSCVLPPGDHIPGWQIHTLLQRMQSKQLPDGRPLETLRVVFLERADAEQEKRPLLDIGVEVYWQDDSGDVRIER